MPAELRWIPLCLIAGLLATSARSSPAESPMVRRPVAIALVDDGARLLVANRDSGTLSLVDPQKRRVVHESPPLAQRISAMAYAGKVRRAAIADEAAGELVLAECRGDRLHAIRRVAVGLKPVSAAIAEDGSWCSVALLWARQVAVVDAEGKVLRLDLPFAPRCQLVLPGNKVMIADAFGDRIAVVDAKAKRVESVRSLAIVHNIRGLALTLDGKGVLLTHQTLHRQGKPHAGDIRAGTMLANNLQRLPLANLLDPLMSLLQSDLTYPLGDIERGAGDPSAVVETPEGRILVALAGTGELAIGKPQEAVWTRTHLGAGPNAIAVDARAGVAYVANTFDDSISVVDWKAAKTSGRLALGPTTDMDRLTAQQRGEMLFHDARLSLDGWLSCHSCHSEGHSNGRLNDNLSDGTLGTPKRVLSLHGVRDTAPLAWNGKTREIETQVRHSIESTMQGKKPPKNMVSDLAAYLRSLEPAPAVAAARQAIEAERFRRGEAMFGRLKCGVCHTSPLYTSEETYDVGLRDEAGLTHFNPPSLRGVSQAGVWLHDGRARTLREVFEVHRHRVPADLPKTELDDLLHFLEGI